ncbi:hypothetical protein [Microcoleus sp. FACHB-68]|uniref:hypothetical protein n=1 Tax=Microcoleus sp. FACHB-68 TaxID=2692826 RepID=UPI0016835DD5|nr:hypothetical protein [Microcoleus sp. FACHB-68]MBD1939750.1 hypothetical protein [Microcoleus sp. FACHB-68]
MLKKIWDRLVHFFQQLFKNSTSSKEEKKEQTPVPINPLSDAGYENFFMQLMDGIGEGWQQAQVLEHLGNRIQDKFFISWLKRFGRDRLLKSPAPNHELATRMVRLSEIGCGEIGEISGEIGTQLLARESQALSEEEYESLFRQLLAKVPFGESVALNFWQDMQYRATTEQWVQWLRRFGETLQEAPDRELANRMVGLKEIAEGEFSEEALTIGTQLLEKLPPVSKWDEIWTGQVIEAVFVGNGLEKLPQTSQEDETETGQAIEPVLIENELEKLPSAAQEEENCTGQVIEAVFIANGLDNSGETNLS